MSDSQLALGWLSILAAGLSVCVLLHHWGLATTYVRDLLHIGAGIWVFGWPFWRSPALPLGIVAIAFSATALAPVLAKRSSVVNRFMAAFAAGDERWNGLTLYAGSFAFFTAVGLLRSPFPAAAGLLALCWGDGLGGTFGRHFGTHYFRAPGGKRKSIEGSAVVALGGMAAVLVSGWWFGVHPGVLLAVGIGIVASLVEALSPRGTDNLLLPLAVWMPA